MNKNKYVIDNYEEWFRAYLNSITDSLEECKIIFYNKEHYEKSGGRMDVDIELGLINTYVDAILHKNSKFPRIRKLCEYIIKGDIVI